MILKVNNGASFVLQALLEVNGHIADLRREAGKVASEEQGDVLEILPVQLLFGEHVRYNW